MYRSTSKIPGLSKAQECLGETMRHPVKVARNAAREIRGAIKSKLQGWSDES
jgi:hypothetical protein